MNHAIVTAVDRVAVACSEGKGMRVRLALVAAL